ncbi:hypothetical protein [Vibrio sp. 10N.261.52.F3]|uniref:hypothetical protein n=1 Tax=Vibrio sp. 10N.261.52.F3 TaxID=3229683 RepID=UPI00354D5A37
MPIHFYISVVSHGHEQLIEKLDALSRLQQYEPFTVMCRDNLNSEALRSYCCRNGIAYQASLVPQGFSSNNNANYLWALDAGMRHSDYFVLFNPDIDIESGDIENLVAHCNCHSISMATINLYINKKKTVFDDNLRRYPTFSTFLKNYCLKDRSTVLDKTNPNSFEHIDYWASGAFLIFRSSLYQQLRGLDESYYLYCEDIDICKRAAKLGHKPIFLNGITATHFRQCKSRRFLSKEFFYHVYSVFLLSSAKWRIRGTKSQITGESDTERLDSLSAKFDEEA